MVMVDIVIPLAHVDAVIRVLSRLLVCRAALWRYFGIAAHQSGHKQSMLRPIAMHDSDIIMTVYVVCVCVIVIYYCCRWTHCMEM